MIDKTITEILEMGENDLISFCDDPKNYEKLQTLERELDHLATVAAARGEYISMRYGSGCGDQGHDSAKKSMEKTRKKVRRALGYAYP